VSSTEKRGRWNPTKTNFWFDIAIFAAALFAPAVAFTGLAIHEWLGIGLALAVVTHLLLHWPWIAQTTKRLVGRTTWTARVNYLVNSLFFVDLTIIIVTGLLISEVSMSQVGLTMPSYALARPLHMVASNAMVLILALHLGLHGKWIVSTASRSMVQPVFNLLRRSKRGSAAPALEKAGVA
jgi:hypothetical protein